MGLIQSRRRLATLVAMIAVLLSTPANPAIGAEPAPDEDAHAPAIELASGVGTVGGDDQNVDVSVDGGRSFRPARILPAHPHPLYATLEGTRWVSNDTSGSGRAFSSTIFRTRFSLPAGFRNPLITVRVHADNAATIRLNGTQIGAQSDEEIRANFQDPAEAYQAANSFMPGINTLQFVVHNFSEYMGLNFKAVISYDRCAQDRKTLSALAQRVLDRIDSPSSLANSPVPKELLLSSCSRLERVLVDGPNIFGEISDIIASAQTEVDMVFYAWEPASDAARLIGQGLKRAQDNPKRKGKLLVRIVVSDDLTKRDPRKWGPEDAVHKGERFMINRLHDSQRTWGLESNEVAVQLATDEHAGMGSLHDKYVVVDGRTVVMTGANPESAHDAGSPWHDTGYLVRGDVGRSLLSSFDDTWDGAQHWACRDRSVALDCAQTRHSSPERSWLTTVHAGSTGMITVGRNATETLGTNSTNNPQDLAWLEVINRARSSVQIMSPNINDDAFRDAVVRAAGRGVEVRLITSKGFNSVVEHRFGGTNDQVVQNLFQRMRKEHPGEEGNLQLCWYSRDGKKPVHGNGGHASHVKFMSVDGELAIIGSGNMDTQSWNYSHELNLLIDGRDGVAQMERAFFNRDWSRAVCPSRGSGE